MIAKSPDLHCALERGAKLARKRRVLAFLINGRREYAAPYDPRNAKDAAELIEDEWPRMRERGRVAIIVETADSNVVDLVQWGAA